MDNDEFARRMEALSGYKNWKASFARGLGMHPTTMRNLFHKGQPVPIYMIACLEFLETMSDRNWPDRWSELKALRRRSQRRP